MHLLSRYICSGIVVKGTLLERVVCTGMSPSKLLVEGINSMVTQR